MIQHIPLPPLEQLNGLFKIVPITESQFGAQSGLVWKIKQGRARAGGVAGYLRPQLDKPGRFNWAVKVEGRAYLASRLIYFMANGVDPGKFQVDHVDRDTLNNNVKNLRLLTPSPQAHNRKMRLDNTSGVTGVYIHKKTGKWRAKLTHERKTFHLGLHTCLIEAARVYNDKVIEFGLVKFGKSLNDLEKIKCSCGHCNR